MGCFGGLRRARRLTVIPRLIRLYFSLVVLLNVPNSSPRRSERSTDALADRWQVGGLSAAGAVGGGCRYLRRRLLRTAAAAAAAPCSAHRDVAAAAAAAAVRRRTSPLHANEQLYKWVNYSSSVAAEAAAASRGTAAADNGPCSACADTEANDSRHEMRNANAFCVKMANLRRLWLRDGAAVAAVGGGARV